MSRETFHIIYDGAALREHEMNAKSLAAALLSIAEIFEEADKVLNHGRTKSEVNIKASFKTGSFKIDFVTVQSVLKNIQEFLISDACNATINGYEILIAVVGTIGAIKFLGKKGISRIEPLDGKNLRIYREDNKYIDVEKQVIDLYENLKIRENLNEAIAKPLEKEGYDEFAIISRDQILQRIEKEDGKFFVTPEKKSEAVFTKESECIFSIVSIIFKKDNKWRLFDGNNEINASISDTKFLSDIENGHISFSKGDRLLCEFKISQFETINGLKTEYEILKIKQHIKRPTQLSLLNLKNTQD